MVVVSAIPHSAYLVQVGQKAMHLLLEILIIHHMVHLG